jgi:uncharacterized pyridoxal phosphate-containing UPF0001 family protein
VTILGGKTEIGVEDFEKCPGRARADHRCGRTVRPRPVSKTRTPAEIQEAIAAGVLHLGENKVQELQEKVAALGRGVTWHLIGTLQTNKVKQALALADLIHSLDRDSLLEALAKEAERRGAPVRALVQVNVSGEATKHGVAPA